MKSFLSLLKRIGISFPEAPSFNSIIKNSLVTSLLYLASSKCEWLDKVAFALDVDENPSSGRFLSDKLKKDAKEKSKTESREGEIFLLIHLSWESFSFAIKQTKIKSLAGSLSLTFTVWWQFNKEQKSLKNKCLWVQKRLGFFPSSRLGSGKPSNP